MRAGARQGRLRRCRSYQARRAAGSGVLDADGGSGRKAGMGGTNRQGNGAKGAASLTGRKPESEGRTSRHEHGSRMSNSASAMRGGFRAVGVAASKLAVTDCRQARQRDPCSPKDRMGGDRRPGMGGGCLADRAWPRRGLEAARRVGRRTRIAASRAAADRAPQFVFWSPGRRPPGARARAVAACCCIERAAHPTIGAKRGKSARSTARRGHRPGASHRPR